MTIDFDKGNGLVPAIVQDSVTNQVLMLGYMNAEAMAQTQTTKRVTFYSRTKQRLWVKGESSGNYLNLIDLKADCDNDTLLVTVRPEGPCCHTGTTTCFGEPDAQGFLYKLQDVIAQRAQQPTEGSYTNQLLRSGMARMAQKVGEEAVELVIEAIKENNTATFKGEAADLMYHLLVLLNAKGLSVLDIEQVLMERR